MRSLPNNTPRCLNLLTLGHEDQFLGIFGGGLSGLRKRKADLDQLIVRPTSWKEVEMVCSAWWKRPWWVDIANSVICKQVKQELRVGQEDEPCDRVYEDVEQKGGAG